MGKCRTFVVSRSAPRTIAVAGGNQVISIVNATVAATEAACERARSPADLFGDRDPHQGGEEDLQGLQLALPNAGKQLEPRDLAGDKGFAVGDQARE